MFNKLLDLLQKQNSGLLLTATILFILLHYSDKITNLLSLFKKTTMPNIYNSNDGSYSSKVLADLDEIKSFQQRGINYVERYNRERIFCLHEQLKGKISYKAISRAAEYIHVDDDNKYVMEIPVLEHVKYYALNAFILLFLFITAALLTALTTVSAASDLYINLSLALMCLYIFCLFVHMNAAMTIAKKISKMIRGRELFYSDKIEVMQ
ncbi:MAG: hypothetical protein ACTHJT_12110 [Cytophaga sp.]|uniref:hypothetical protein n=1 Tax=Cytophaga sp. TaxID=29535 RepID=UPI003F7E5385